MSRERKRQLIEAVIENAIGLGICFGGLWAFCEIMSAILQALGVA